MISKVKDIIRYIYYLNSYLRFKKRGKNLLLSLGGTFVRPEEIEFGDNVFISSNFYISARNLVFKNDIMIGPNLVIECDNHVYNEVGKTMYAIKDKRVILPITIENDVWIGANVTILGGVTVGTGSIVGAGSVVIKSY